MAGSPAIRWATSRMGGSVRISTLASRMKYANLVADPTVTFCVVDRDDHTRYVELRGHATLEPDPDRSFLRLQFLWAPGPLGATGPRCPSLGYSTSTKRSRPIR